MPTRDNHRAGLGLATLLGLLLSACASAPPAVIEPMASIHNNSGKALREIRYQACGQDESSWSTLPDSRLTPGARKQFRLPGQCVNLLAYYEDGKVAGTQRGVKREFPLSWVLY